MKLVNRWLCIIIIDVFKDNILIFYSLLIFLILRINCYNISYNIRVFKDFYNGFDVGGWL